MASASVKNDTYRKKIKSDPVKWEQYKEHERQRLRQIRARNKEAMSDEQKTRQREQSKDRKHRSRLRKKYDSVSNKEDSKENLPHSAYKSKCTLNKAVNKTMKTLPAAREKQRAVLTEIVSRNFDGKLDHPPFKGNKLGRKSIPQETMKKVTNFYTRDDISWQSPGKFDAISIRDPKTGIRESVQKRYLIMNIRETKAIFDQEMGTSICSLTTFYRLRPKFVLPFSKTPHSVCLCIVHANFIHLAKALQPYYTKLESYKDIIYESSCSITDENCMFGECERCRQFDFSNLLLPGVNVSSEITVYKWTKGSFNYELTDCVTTINSAVREMNRIIPEFKRHSFIKTTQADHFSSTKSNLKNNKAAVQVDFAANAVIVNQGEIQSAHWCQRQVTIFTCVIWIRDSTISYAVISDDLTHSKYAAWLFLKSIVVDFRTENYSIEVLHTFSDNCAAQFKSKYTVANLCFLPQDVGVQSLSWNTFAAGHGKGSVDAIGGTVKRVVWQAVKARQVKISSAFGYYEVAKEKCKGIKVLYVSKESVRDAMFLLEKRWQKVKEIKGIQAFHSFQRSDESQVNVSYTIKSKKRTLRVFSNEPAKQLKVDEVYSDEGEG